MTVRKKKTFSQEVALNSNNNMMMNCCHTSVANMHLLDRRHVGKTLFCLNNQLHLSTEPGCFSFIFAAGCLVIFDFLTGLQDTKEPEISFLFSAIMRHIFCFVKKGMTLHKTHHCKEKNTQYSITEKKDIPGSFH